jgi:integrase
MPRPVVWPPQPREHKASGQSRVRIGGRDYYLGPHGSEEARRRYAELISTLVQNGQQAPAEKRPDAPAGLLVCDVLARWVIHARGYYSERGREREQFRLALRPLERMFGMTPVALFDADCLRDVQQAMLDGSWMEEGDRLHPRAPKSGGWSRPVVNARVKRVRTVWRWAEEKKLVAPGTWAALCGVKPVRPNRPGAREPQRAKTTTMAEVRAVCRRLTSVLRAMVLTQFWSGMRSGELREMLLSELDRTGEVWVYRPGRHKTDYLGHSRSVYLGPRAQAVLRPFVRLAQSSGQDGPVFPSPRGGGCWTRDGYSHACRVAADAAGLPHWHPYLSRGATRMRLSRGASDEAARAGLGHRSFDVTEKYGSLDESLARDAAARLG